MIEMPIMWREIRRGNIFSAFPVVEQSGNYMIPEYKTIADEI